MEYKGKEITVNLNFTNAKIKAHILSDSEMRKIGFTDNRESHWYYYKYLKDEVTFNVSIPKDGSDISIDILDEDFLQPYDYQYILEEHPGYPFALKIRDMVEEQMEYLHNCGVLEGHVCGEYI